MEALYSQYLPVNTHCTVYVHAQSNVLFEPKLD